MRNQADRYGGGVDRGADYTAAELEFMQAVDRYRREQRKPFPTLTEVLSILLSLGYRKPPS